VEPVPYDAEGDKDERLDLRHQDEEDQGEGRRAEAPFDAIRERDLHESAHRPSLTRGRRASKPYSSVAERSGPTPTMPIGAPTVCSIFARYARAASGRCARSETAVTSVRQPAQVS